MCFKSFLLHKLICIVYLLKYLNNNVTVTVDPLYCFFDNNNRSRAVLAASRTPRKSIALGPIPTQPLIGIKL
jgi:hypothetical protein